jgi:hypothetical protein
MSNQPTLFTIAHSGSWSIACPQCHAEPGERCSSANGGYYPQYTHKARRLVFKHTTKPGDVVITLTLHDSKMKDSMPLTADLAGIDWVLRKYGTVSVS